MPAHSTRGPGSQSRFEEALIREALYPYPDGLAIVSKVAARSDGDGASLRFDESRELRQGLEDNLAALGAGRLAAVNLRVAAAAGHSDLSPLRATRRRRQRGQEYLRQDRAGL